MNILIIEDEQLAANRLEKIIQKLDRSVEVLQKIESVERAVQWFKHNSAPDLAFFDIQLADGLSFEIFDKIEVKCPIIFTTAFDEYALKAFKVNSIDYLLKPIDPEELGKAMEKYKALFAKNQPSQKVPNLHKLEKALEMLNPNTKSRFVVKTGERIQSIQVEQILYFVSREKATFIYAKDDRKYLIDYSLEQVEKMVDKKRFFRINRKYIIAIDAIQDIISYSNSRLKLNLIDHEDNDIIVSREKVSDFKLWLDQ
ncbi:LytR/AlgR family response regulator transcription factor [Xanthovirga aplysinae]|uniref:LytR/AlgR family response regulator transcription factor n=1 Tax=Xanthovirga aplysinae TaxID=2529853 RepID=UPI0012BD01DF|nr:LytTR family DNA-binding domain-containing protein [Xanthovirga aplysinae]MTI32617.1 response regulator transcription factor [Xanthovirga aplysinae]